MASTSGPERVRDPLHNLIHFPKDDFGCVLWEVLQTAPMQRLRRVKQLGFSDLVFPGATHSRFAHSLGAFHIATKLIGVIERHNGAVHCPIKEQTALAAALLHDVGHGPFSHAFETVSRELGLEWGNHEDVSRMLILDGEIGTALSEMGPGFARDVADMVAGEGAKSVYHAVVSSQFDADRLDYMQRDRLMTGTHHSGIDFAWLMDNLETRPVAIGVDDEASVATVDTLVLNAKAVRAAEAYVIGLFHLYPTVYFHKTSRGAEKLFARLMCRLFELVRDGSIARTGLDQNHPLVKFAGAETLDATMAILLDDSVIWGALSQLAESTDEYVSEYARRLRDRNLYKCFDIYTEVAKKLAPGSDAASIDNSVLDETATKIIAKVRADGALNSVVLFDEANRLPYKTMDESEGPLNRINVLSDGGKLVDLAELSPIVKGLEPFKVVRAYYPGPNGKHLRRLEAIVDEEVKDVS